MLRDSTPEIRCRLSTTAPTSFSFGGNAGAPLAATGRGRAVLDSLLGSLTTDSWMMTTPSPLPECVHRGSVLEGMQLCRKRRGWKPLSACGGCADRTEARLCRLSRCHRSHSGASGVAIPFTSPRPVDAQPPWSCFAAAILLQRVGTEARTEIERATVPEELCGQGTAARPARFATSPPT